MLDPICRNSPLLKGGLKVQVISEQKNSTFIDLPITEPLNFNIDQDIHQYVNFLLDDAINYLLTSKKDSFNNFNMLSILHIAKNY